MSCQIYVLRYEHRHGVDMSAYATGDQANKARADLALAYVHELGSDDDAERIRELYAVGDYDAAVGLYLESHTGESMDIEMLEVQGFDAGVSVRDACQGLVHHALVLPSTMSPGLTACGEPFWWQTELVGDASPMRVTLPLPRPPLTCFTCMHAAPKTTQRP